MHPGGGFDIIASIVGLGVLALGLAEIGRSLRDALDRAFGAQMRHQFPAPPEQPDCMWMGEP